MSNQFSRFSSFFLVSPFYDVNIFYDGFVLEEGSGTLVSVCFYEILHFTFKTHNKVYSTYAFKDKHKNQFVQVK